MERIAEPTVSSGPTAWAGTARTAEHADAADTERHRLLHLLLQEEIGFCPEFHNSGSSRNSLVLGSRSSLTKQHAPIQSCSKYFAKLRSLKIVRMEPRTETGSGLMQESRRHSRTKPCCLEFGSCTAERHSYRCFRAARRRPFSAALVLSLTCGPAGTQFWKKPTCAKILPGRMGNKNSRKRDSSV